jgi:hypothetical protein
MPGSRVTRNFQAHRGTRHQLAKDGIILLGHLRTVQGKQMILAPDLEENLTKADTFEIQITQAIDEYIKKTGMNVAANSTIGEVPHTGALTVKQILTLDLQSAGRATAMVVP